MKKKVYLACPYSDPDPEVMVDRFNAINRIALALMAEGHVVFSPISHSHPIAQAVPGGLPASWEFWKEQDMPFLHWADELHVAPFPGWNKSVGVRAEILAAGRANKPIKYLDLEKYLDGAENFTKNLKQKD